MNVLLYVKIITALSTLLVIVITFVLYISLSKIPPVSVLMYCGSVAGVCLCQWRLAAYLLARSNFSPTIDLVFFTYIVLQIIIALMIMTSREDFDPYWYWYLLGLTLAEIVTLQVFVYLLMDTAGKVLTADRARREAISYKVSLSRFPRAKDSIMIYLKDYKPAGLDEGSSNGKAKKSKKKSRKGHVTIDESEEEVFFKTFPLVPIRDTQPQSSRQAPQHPGQAVSRATTSTDGAARPPQGQASARSKAGTESQAAGVHATKPNVTAPRPPPQGKSSARPAAEPSTTTNRTPQAGQATQPPSQEQQSKTKK